MRLKCFKIKNKHQRQQKSEPFHAEIALCVASVLLLRVFNSWTLGICYWTKNEIKTNATKIKNQHFHEKLEFDVHIPPHTKKADICTTCFSLCFWGLLSSQKIKTSLKHTNQKSFKNLHSAYHMHSCANWLNTCFVCLGTVAWHFFARAIKTSHVEISIIGIWLGFAIPNRISANHQKP